MQNHFSVNAASELLERTRRTVKRALRNTQPDSFERGQPRWRLPKIIAALEATGGRPVSEGGDPGSEMTHKLDALFEQFDAAYDEMKAAPALARRRAMARALAPLIAQTDQLLRARDAADDLHPEHVDLRANRVFFLILRGFETPCEWSHDEAWNNLDVRE
jgi:hypothetical protein